MQSIVIHRLTTHLKFERIWSEGYNVCFHNYYEFKQ